MALTILIIVCGALVVWGGWAFWKGAQAAIAAEKKVQKEMKEIGHLDVNVAEKKARHFLKTGARLQNWSAHPPAEIASALKFLEPRLSKLLLDYRKISFTETGTEVSAELLLCEAPIEGLRVIGKNSADGCELCVKSDSPIVHEVSSGQVRETYPSIFHFFLLVEDS